MRLAPIAALVPLLAACGAPAASPTPSPSPTSELAVYRELAACVRAHGYPNLPDPVQDPQTGRIDLPRGAPTPPESALKPCKSIVDRLPRGKDGRDKPLTAAEVAKLKEFAKCVRAHGLPDWPDPNPDGEFAVPQHILDQGKNRMRPYFEACPQAIGIRVKVGDGHG